MSDCIFKERIPCSDGVDVECNVLEVKVYYDLGGISWATGENMPRGYYLSVSPLEVTEHTVTYTGFSGTRMNLTQCKRKSKKAEVEALKLLPEYKQKLIDYVCAKHGIKLDA